MPPSDFMTRYRERKAWEAANPELAAEWAAALEEDDTRAKAREAAEARAQVERDMPRLLRRLGVLHEHIAGWLLGLDERPTMRAARRYLAQDSLPVLFLAGKTEAGKTQAAVEVLADWVRRHPWNAQPSGRTAPLAVYLQASELAAFRRFQDGGEAVLRELMAAPVLVLDDVGTEVATGIGNALLYDVVCARHGNNRRTVVTTNLGPEELKRDYDERVLRRLRSDSICLIGGVMYEGGKRVTPELKAVGK